MNRTGLSIVVAVLFASSARAQSETGAQAGAQTSGQASVEARQTEGQASGNVSASSSASAQQANTSLGSGTTFNAALNAPVDSKKAKPGDPVTAHTTEAAKSEGKTVIPKGSKLVGHVTQSSARAKGESESALGIVFDKAILKNGQELPLHVAIQAIASAESSASVAGADLDTVGGMGASASGSGAAGGRGARGGVTSTAGGAVGTVTNTAANIGSAAGGTMNSTAGVAGSAPGAVGGATGGLNGAGQLTSNSRGVFGLNGLNLNQAASNAAEGSVITSAGKNVHLDSGTQMLLVSQAQAGTRDESAKPDNPAPKSEPKSEPHKPSKP